MLTLVRYVQLQNTANSLIGMSGALFVFTYSFVWTDERFILWFIAYLLLPALSSILFLVSLILRFRARDTKNGFVLACLLNALPTSAMFHFLWQNSYELLLPMR